MLLVNDTVLAAARRRPWSPGSAGCCVPRLIARVPEPEPKPEAEADVPADEPPKTLYADIAARPGLAWRSAVVSAACAAPAGAGPPARTGRCCGWCRWRRSRSRCRCVDWHTRLLPRVVVAARHAGGRPRRRRRWGCATDQREALVRALVAMVVARSFFWVLWFVRSAGMGFGDVRLAAPVGPRARLGRVGCAGDRRSGSPSSSSPSPRLVLALVRRDRAHAQEVVPVRSVHGRRRAGGSRLGDCARWPHLGLRDCSHAPMAHSRRVPRSLAGGDPRGAARPRPRHDRRPRRLPGPAPPRLRPRRPDEVRAGPGPRARRRPARRDPGRTGGDRGRQHRVAQVGEGHVGRPGRPGRARGAGAQRRRSPGRAPGTPTSSACRSTPSTRRARSSSGRRPARPRRASRSAAWRPTSSSRPSARASCRTSSRSAASRRPPASYPLPTTSSASTPTRSAASTPRPAPRWWPRIDQAHKDGDTLGGVVEVVVHGLPPGLGSHVHWDRRLDARLAGALMGIQAIKGVEVGDGFELARHPGLAGPRRDRPDRRRPAPHVGPLRRHRGRHDAPARCCACARR